MSYKNIYFISYAQSITLQNLYEVVRM